MLRNDTLVSLRCGGRVLDLSSPIVMGIINATPDSFYAGSRLDGDLERAVALAVQMAEEGAQILDIGGMSSRPGAVEIPVEEELERVIPVIQAIRHKLPEMILSLDTYRAPVALEGIGAGINIINDISGGNLSTELIEIAALHRLPYVLMHMRGTSADMHLHTDYQDLMGELIKYFVERIRLLKEAGVNDIILDPGFGFSKTMAQNYEIIRKLGLFSILPFPVLVGVSRKSTLSKTIDRPAEETLEATTALHMSALINGARMLRVHDVRPAMDAIAVYRQLYPRAGRNNK